MYGEGGEENVKMAHGEKWRKEGKRGRGGRGEGCTKVRARNACCLMAAVPIQSLTLLLVASLLASFLSLLPPAGLTTLFLTYTRLSQTSDQLTQFLEDLTLPPLLVSLCVEAYKETRVHLIPLLKKTGLGPEFRVGRKLLGFDYSIIYRVRSSGTGENVPVFLCRFRIMDVKVGGEVEEMMELGLGEMKDMLWKVRQANMALK